MRPITQATTRRLSTATSRRSRRAGRSGAACTHFVTTSLSLRQVKAYAQQLKSWVLPEKARMNLHEQLGALEMGVDQLIQAVVAPQAENIPETPAHAANA